MLREYGGRRATSWGCRAVLWLAVSGTLAPVVAKEWRVQLRVVSLKRADGGGCDRTDVGKWVQVDRTTGRLKLATSGDPETFMIQAPRDALVDGDRVQLRSTTTGNWVCAEGGGGGMLVANRAAAREWETFVLGDQTSSRPEDRRVRQGEAITLKTHTGRFWRISNHELDAGGTGQPSRCDVPATLKLLIERPSNYSYPQLSAPFRTPASFGAPIGMDHQVHGKKKEDYRCSLPGSGMGEGNPIDAGCCVGARGADFPRCYRGHEGSDFMLKGLFAQQDASLATEVVAALAGQVVNVGDGNVDHCVLGPQEGDRKVRCYPPGSPDERKLVANFVEIAHENGVVTAYYHLQKNSVTVRAGDRVAAGTRLGRVGSSGISSGSHLHFHVVCQAPRSYTGVRDAPFDTAEIYVDPYRTPEGKVLWDHLDDSGVPDRPAGGAALTIGIPFTNVDLRVPAPQAKKLKHPQGHTRTVPCAHMVSKHPEGHAGPRIPCIHGATQEHGATCRIGRFVKPCTHWVPKHRNGDDGPKVPCTELVAQHPGGHPATEPCTHWE